MDFNVKFQKVQLRAQKIGRNNFYKKQIRIPRHDTFEIPAITSRCVYRAEMFVE